ncbi:MAG: hypothetical protein VZR27_06860 [Acutalibacteraceae bacterium]|nr:hypothetical protein [Acutalibacteraceae bacterium]
MNETYETKISNARWILYDIPGNIGWIVYIVCTAVLLKEKGSLFTVAAFVPAIIMLVGIAELISERVVKLDRVLSKARLYRGFGALTLGGILGAVVSFVEFVIIGGLTPFIMLISSVLCAAFAGLLFKGYKKR